MLRLESHSTVARDRTPRLVGEVTREVVARVHLQTGFRRHALHTPPGRTVGQHRRRPRLRAGAGAQNPVVVESAGQTQLLVGVPEGFTNPARLGQVEASTQRGGPGSGSSAASMGVKWSAPTRSSWSSTVPSEPPDRFQYAWLVMLTGVGASAHAA